jgi:hypothetical protein
MKQDLNLNHPVRFSDLSIVKTPFSREIEQGLLFLTDTKKGRLLRLETVSGKYYERRKT